MDSQIGFKIIKSKSIVQEKIKRVFLYKFGPYAIEELEITSVGQRPKRIWDQAR